MPSVFLISDTHFGHGKMYGPNGFTGNDGLPCRPFQSAEEADEIMVQRWNETIHLGDKVYHLGDVAISHKSLPILERLNGRKVLIKGNHDIFELKKYIPYFKDIRAYHVLSGMILSHVPIHPSSIGRFGGNVHGHCHSNPSPLGPYVSVCVEKINYTPVELTVVSKMLGNKMLQEAMLATMREDEL